ncbi:transferase hexapeptide (six repeat-containing protein) [Flavobacterium gillisiae]|uniref:Transferase hexapeptide (Six repeat-containing protein) n=1 Tax=Flavobacterium gillisiae TaxID=150146 RepID=A0A1H4EPS6_9FLAO|nr:hypothetical protein [Flavobacterium gillisiae]SEA87083.1 transferase hexapeptide (six repeat-containing protein) [Flavobacterium gillisiae]
MIDLIKNILRPCVRTIKLLIRLNLSKTIYFNFATQPFSVAVRFPFFIYGKFHIHILKGQVKINSKVTRGMIKIGYREFDLAPISFLPNQYLNTGKLIFNGPAIVSGGVSLSINGGLLNIGSCCTIGGGTLIKATNEIFIGANTRITFGCVVFDSNIHYVKNITTGVIKNNNGPVFIGSNCWINSGAYIVKDALIPDYSIVARNSLVNKDFSKDGYNLFIVGSPAKVAANNVQRIFSINEEARLSSFFDENDLTEYQSEQGLFVDRNEIFDKHL